MGCTASSAEVRQANTIPKRIQYWARTLPNRDMFVFYHGEVRETYTFKKVLELAGKFAGRLRREYGFRKGDIIANTMPNSPERVITDLGITLAGCVCMNGSILFSDGSDFQQAARNSSMVAVVVNPHDSSPVWRMLRPYATNAPIHDTVALSNERAPDLTRALLVKRTSGGRRQPFLACLEGSDEEMFVDDSITPEDPMYVFTTSGSTGYCKLVSKSHIDIFDTWEGIQEQVARQSRHVLNQAVYYNDRLIGWMGGFPWGTYLYADTRVMIDVFETHGLKSAGDMWKTICHERVDYGLIMPLDLDGILKYIRSEGAGGYKMKIIGCGGQPIRKDQFASFHTIADEIVPCYGSTEAGFLTCGVISDSHIKDFYCGRAVEGVQVRVVDDRGRVCAPGQMGTVHATGKGVFKGYLNRMQNPDPKTLEAFTKDGWFDMQDSGYLDENGDLHVLGRQKDVIMLGASIVYPGWVEKEIVEHPDVAEACVVPVSDPVLYHNICAVVKPVPGRELKEEQLREFCEHMFLSDKQAEGTPVPAFYLIMEQFPKTSTGKVDRALLQAEAEKLFGVR